MSLQFDTGLRNGMLNQITSSVGTSARFRVYSGTVPTNCAAGIGAATLLVDLPCTAAFAAAAASGVLTANAITQTNAVAGGTASFFRIYDSAATTCYVQGLVGTSGSDLNLNTTTIASGGPLQMTGLTITAPGA